MGSVGSRQVAVDPDIAEKFAARAKRLGTTQDKEISRALREWLATQEPAASDQIPSEGDASAEAVGWRLVEEHGFLMIDGDIPADAIPDHRDLREERIDELVGRSQWWPLVDSLSPAQDIPRRGLRPQCSQVSLAPEQSHR